MVSHFFANFLNDAAEYDQSVQLWQSLWSRVSSTRGWITPWLSTGAPSLLDGNPIFSTVNPRLRRGVRIIQHEPTTDAVEIQVWTDTFGGAATDPDSIAELVIDCALSDRTAEIALTLMWSWVAKGEIVFTQDKAGQMLPKEVIHSERMFSDAA